MPGSRQNLHGVSAPLENASRDRCADAQLVIKSVASEAPEDYPELWLPVPLNRLMSVRGNRRWRSLALLCWLVFAAGLLVQLLSPHLKISNGAFVIPPEMATGRNAIRPDEIIARQRRIQLLSVLLTVSGALGLAFLYRDILIGAASRRSSEPVEEPACADSMRSQHPDATRKTLDEENPNKMKAITMRIQKFSRPGVILMATVVAIITSMVAANATQTITTPNAAFISYNLAAGANSAVITPATSRSVLVMGCCTSAGVQGVGQVSLQHIPSTFIEWVGLESFCGPACPEPTTSGASGAAGTHIVYIDINHLVDIQVASADTIRVHNGTGFTRAGNVTLIW